LKRLQLIETHWQTFKTSAIFQIYQNEIIKISNRLVNLKQTRTIFEY